MSTTPAPHRPASDRPAPVRLGSAPTGAPDRERWVDALRAGALLVVVVGHWLMAVVTLSGVGADTDLTVSPILEGSVAVRLLTWPLQVMPVFFAAGAYVVARSHLAVPVQDRVHSGVGRRSWGAFMSARVRRLVIPTLPLLALWWLATPALADAFGADVVTVAAGAALVPLWFLATYLLVQALVPLLIRVVDRHGVIRPVVACLVLTALVDVAHHDLDIIGIGFSNFVWVWSIPTLLGIGVAQSRLARRALLLAAPIAVVVAGVLISQAGYALPVVGVGPSGGRGNTSPPSIVLALHALAYTSLAMALAPRAETWLAATRRRRRALGSAAELSMPVYLWHMTAMVAVAACAVLVHTAAGATVPGLSALLAIEPLTSAWWATRPVWIAVNGVAVVVLLQAVRWPTVAAGRLVGRLLPAGDEPPVVTLGALMAASVGLGVIVSGAQPVPAAGGALMVCSLATGAVWRTWVRMRSPLSRGRSSSS